MGIGYSNKVETVRQFFELWRFIEIVIRDIKEEERWRQDYKIKQNSNCSKIEYEKVESQWIKLNEPDYYQSEHEWCRLIVIRYWSLYLQSTNKARQSSPKR